MINSLGSTSTLAVFQRHLGVNAPTERDSAPSTPAISTPTDRVEFDSKKLEIEAFSRDIKGANEFIGALQNADVALKKMQKEGENLAWIGQSLHDPLMDSETKGALESQSKESLEVISALAQNSTFMGKKLFERELVSEVSGIRFSLSLQNPAALGTEAGDYITAKRSEISEKISMVSEVISASATTENPNNYNFDEFDPSAFMKLF